MQDPWKIQPWPLPSDQIVDCCFMNNNSDLVMLILSQLHLRYINIHCYLFACQMLKFQFNSFIPGCFSQINSQSYGIPVHLFSREPLLRTHLTNFSFNILSDWPKNYNFLGLFCASSIFLHHLLHVNSQITHPTCRMWISVGVSFCFWQRNSFQRLCRKLIKAGNLCMGFEIIICFQ